MKNTVGGFKCYGHIGCEYCIEKDINPELFHDRYLIVKTNYFDNGFTLNIIPPDHKGVYRLCNVIEDIEPGIIVGFGEYDEFEHYTDDVKAEGYLLDEIFNRYKYRPIKIEGYDIIGSIGEHNVYLRTLDDRRVISYKREAWMDVEEFLKYLEPEYYYWDYPIDETMEIEISKIKNKLICILEMNKENEDMFEKLFR